VRFYGAELILALEHIHRQGIVYRDLKVGVTLGVVYLNSYYSPLISCWMSGGIYDCQILGLRVNFTLINLRLVCKYDS